MTAAEAAAHLHDLWERKLRSTFDVKLPSSDLANARAAYTCADADEQRAAYWSFQRKGVQLADTAPPPIAASFVIEGASLEDSFQRVDGYDTGQRWNGWAVPLVDLEQLTALINRWNASNDDSMRFELIGDVLHVTENANDAEAAEHSSVSSVPTTCADGVIRNLYDVGLGFVWEVA